MAWVNAPSETLARGYAEQAFKRGTGSGWVGPWVDSALVMVRDERKDTSMREGVIYVPYDADDPEGMRVRLGGMT